MGDALVCHRNVNCPELNGLTNQRDAVARILIQFDGGAGWCSGTLINNTAQDDFLYFLTANHCFSDNLDALGATAATQWIFYWNYESADCNNPAWNRNSVLLQVPRCWQIGWTLMSAFSSSQKARSQIIKSTLISLDGIEVQRHRPV